MNKAAVSIPSNIAKGCGPRTIPDLVHFVHIAIGSSFELETQIEICYINDYIDIAVYSSLFKKSRNFKNDERVYQTS